MEFPGEPGLVSPFGGRPVRKVSFGEGCLWRYGAKGSTPSGRTKNKSKSKYQISNLMLP